jgi:hypothetical protein
MPVGTLDGEPVGDGGPGPRSLEFKKLYWEAHTRPQWTTQVDYSMVDHDASRSQPEPDRSASDRHREARGTSTRARSLASERVAIMPALDRLTPVRTEKLFIERGERHSG